MERGLADRERGHAVDLDQAALDQVERERVRHEVHRSSGVAQGVDELAHPRDVGERQGDVDDLDAFLTDEIRSVPAVARQFVRVGDLRQAIDAAEIEVAHEAGRRQPAGELHTDLVHADDDVAGSGGVLRAPAHLPPQQVSRRQCDRRHDEPGQNRVAAEDVGRLEGEAGEEQQADDGAATAAAPG